MVTGAPSIPKKPGSAIYADCSGVASNHLNLEMGCATTAGILAITTIAVILMRWNYD
jgi:hypothetical protein